MSSTKSSRVDQTAKDGLGEATPASNFPNSDRVKGSTHAHRGGNKASNKAEAGLENSWQRSQDKKNQG